MNIHLIKKHAGPDIQRHGSGLVRVIDGSTGVAHSAHPNVQDSKQNRRKHPGWIPAWGFLFSPDLVTGTDPKTETAKFLCACPACQERYERGERP